MTFIVAIHGKAQSGKDTAAEVLECEIMSTEWIHMYAFAEPVKEIVSVAFGIPRASLDSERGKSERYPCGFTGRQLLQKVGTEMFRGTFGDDFWANNLVRKIRRERPDVAIISDLRAPVELQKLQQFADGRMVSIKLLRDVSSSASGTGHSSEELLPDDLFDYVIPNQDWNEETFTKYITALAEKINDHPRRHH